MDVSIEECVHEVLDVIPIVMRSLRMEFRSHRGSDLSIPQYRALMFLRRNPGASLSAVTEHLAIRPPSTSKMINGLVERGLVDRRLSGVDRRRVNLALTSTGVALTEQSYLEAQAAYVERFSMLPKESLVTITQAMKILRRLFDSEGQTVTS